MTLASRWRLKTTPKHTLLIILSVFFVVVIILGEALSQQDRTEYENRLKKISDQIKILKEKLAQEEKRESTILSRLENVGIRKNLLRKEINMYAMQNQRANQELIQIQDSLMVYRTKLDQSKEAVVKILVALYKYNHLSYVEFLLQVKDLNELISENKNLTLLAQHQDKTITEYMAVLASLKEAEAKQEAKQKEIAQLAEHAQTKNRELDNQERLNREIIQDISQNKKTYQEAVAEQEERARQLQEIISNLSGQKIPTSIRLSPLYDKKGRLPWPLNGRILTPFGEQRHPRFKTVTMNNGIEISAQPNMNIKAIHPGIVVFNNYIKGYGNTLIIDHGMSYYSLYGHCSEFYVAKGEGIEAEHSIAMVGDIGSLKGPSLYFGIYYKSKPLDPLQWLKRR